MRAFSIQSDSRGASAIEYAIIAGLIGLGLVGSLVATRGSLSSIFGVASSQMGSANGVAPAGPGRVTSQRAVAAASTSARAPFWNAKTLSSKVVTNPDANSQLTTFTYADGSVATYLAKFDNAGVLTGETQTTYPGGIAGRTNDTMQMQYDASGAATQFFYIFRNADNSVYLTALSTPGGGWAETVTPYTNGSPGTPYQAAPTRQTTLDQAKADEIYFRALSQ